MSAENDRLLGKGIYSLYEATRLSGASSSTIRRWLLGYSYKSGNQRKRRPPIFESDIGEIDGVFTISFRDLIELLFVHAFRERGVKWAIIHEAFDLARERFESQHPFSAINFKTDGKRIFEETILRGETKLADLNKQQFVISDFIQPTLVKALEFDRRSVQKWYPNFPSKIIVLDPKRSFGRPIVDESGVPTQVINAAFQVEQDAAIVAAEFETKRSAVEAAVRFEARLAA